MIRALHIAVIFQERDHSLTTLFVMGLMSVSGFSHNNDVGDMTKHTTHRNKDFDK